jgi:hypothetical protein
MEGNRSWAKQCGEEMPELLPKLATGQVSLDISAVRQATMPSGRATSVNGHELAAGASETRTETNA